MRSVLKARWRRRRIVRCWSRRQRRCGRSTQRAGMEEQWRPFVERQRLYWNRLPAGGRQAVWLGCSIGCSL